MNLDPLLKPGSIAIVGASQKPSISTNIIHSLEHMNFEGDIYPINPKYVEVLGYRCYPALDALPASVDLVAFSIGYKRLESEIGKAAENGARAAVVFSGGFGESGEEGAQLQARITEKCREAQIALCGPNCMGVLSPHSRSSAYMMEVVDVAGLRGNVGLISQSGSVCIGMTGDVSRFGFSHIISSGNEAIVSTAAYLEFLVADDDTKVIALFTESINEPERFVAALDAAAEVGKPVVVVKVGKSQRAAAAIRTHTGGLAGESRMFSELLRAHRAIEVEDIEALCEVLAVCQGNRWPTGERLSVITASGGHAELILDIAQRHDISLPPLPDVLRSEIESVVGPLTGDGNPVDAWGVTGDANVNFPCALKALGGAPDNYDAVLFVLDSSESPTTEFHGSGSLYADLVGNAADTSGLPHYLLSTRHGVFKRDTVKRLLKRGVPSLGGLDKGMPAIARVSRLSLERPALIKASGGSHNALAKLGRRDSVNEHEAKRLLARAGVAVPEEQLVDNCDDALSAAESLGYPVVLKVVSDQIPHRTELDLVKVGLTDAEAVRTNFGRMKSTLESLGLYENIEGFLVQSMVADGVEVIAGVQRDPAFGLFLMAGVGGILSEVLNEVSLRLLPLRAGDVETMIDETRLGELLSGLRGRQESDREALHKTLYALADFAMDNHAYIESIDVNPLVVHARGNGCIAVDALIIGR